MYPVWLVIYFVTFCHLVFSLHSEDISQQSISMEDYLTQLTESVQNEIDGNSMMGHKPPNRWYSTNNHGHKPTNQKIENGMAILLQKHYRYLQNVRKQLQFLNNKIPGKLDMWPLRKPVTEEGKSALETATGATEAHETIVRNGFLQPEWMDDIFDHVMDIKLQMEEMQEG